MEGKHKYRDSNGPFRSCARDVIIERLTMHHGTILGDANKKPIPKNSPVMHCQRRYYQASSPTSEWWMTLLCVGHVGVHYITKESTTFFESTNKENYCWKNSHVSTSYFKRATMVEQCYIINNIVILAEQITMLTTLLAAGQLNIVHAGQLNLVYAITLQ